MVPRFLQLVALVLAFVVSGAPAWIRELAKDDCAEECASDRSCPDDGCGDCSIVCSSCARVHVVVPSLVASAVAAPNVVTWISSEAGERVPDDPVPDGVFHPPRLAAG
jgi:hypothetical protein